MRPYPAPAADALLAALAAQQAAVRGMNARVRATSWLGGERVRATVNMLVERDGHLRFEAEVSLQGTVATLATDGTTFTLYDAHKNEVSRGPACPANVASLVRIPLAPADVAAVLLGDARAAAAGGSRHRDRRLGRAPRRRRAGAARARRRRDAAVPVSRRRRGAHAGRGRSRRRGPARRCGAPPTRTTRASAARVCPGIDPLRRAAASFDDGVEIKFKDRTLNAAPPAGAFTLAPPAGATVIEVGCGPAPK